MLCTGAVSFHEFPLHDPYRLFLRRFDGEGKDLFFLPTADGQQSVGRDGTHWFLPIEIVTEFLSFLFLVSDDFCLYHPFAPEEFANGLTGFRIFIGHLGDDVARACQCFLSGGDACFCIDEGRCQHCGIRRSLFQDLQRKWFQSFLPCHRCARLPARTVGQVDVLQFGK